MFINPSFYLFFKFAEVIPLHLLLLDSPHTHTVINRDIGVSLRRAKTKEKHTHASRTSMGIYTSCAFDRSPAGTMRCSAAFLTISDIRTHKQREKIYIRNVHFMQGEREYCTRNNDSNTDETEEIRTLRIE